MSQTPDHQIQIFINKIDKNEHVQEVTVQLRAISHHTVKTDIEFKYTDYGQRDNIETVKAVILDFLTNFAFNNTEGGSR